MESSGVAVWVAVAERLPETHTPVLVWLAAPYQCHTVACIASVERMDAPYPSYPSYQVGGHADTHTDTQPGARRVLWELQAGVEESFTEAVTHWMPLPQPPDGSPWPIFRPNALPQRGFQGSPFDIVDIARSEGQ